MLAGSAVKAALVTFAAMVGLRDGKSSGMDSGMPEMTPEMAEAAVAFLRQTLPGSRPSGWDVDGWVDNAMTAYQIGCMALVALGQAERMPWGAAALPKPQPPNVLPFWEDVAVSVLWLARQHHQLAYRQMDGSQPDPRGQWIIRRQDAPPPPAPNLMAGPGTGPALASEAVIEVLEALGLAAGGRWTAAAEVVHWRGSGQEWGLSFEADPRFQTAVASALATMPGRVRREIDSLMRITAADIAEGLAQSSAAVEDLRTRYGSKGIGAPQDEAQVKRSLAFQREDDLDWVFFRRWRLGRGWLDEALEARALHIFHDRLAIALRKAVVAQLYPGGFVWT
jgi:hypothetical protein